MVKLQDISKKINNNIIVDKINIYFPSTGLIGIIGESGAGKSTLLNILAGYIKPSSGNYHFDQIDMLKNNRKTWDDIRKNDMSFIFQECKLFDHLSLEENIKTYLITCSKEVKPNEIDRVLNKLDLLDKKSRIVKDLSGGEKQRVMIANALLKGSKIILADEPTGSLDEKNTNEIFGYLKEISKDILVILVTHQKNTLLEYTKDFIELSKGKVVDNQIKENLNYKVQDSNNKRKIKIKDLFTLQKNIFYKQYFRRVFSVIFLMISFFISFFSFSYYTYSEANLLNHIKETKQIEFNYISQSTSELVYEKLNIEAFNHPNLNFYTVYNNQFDFKMSDFNKNTSGEKIFQTVVVKNIEENAIIITDYQADKLKENGILKFTEYSELINQSISFNQVNLKIVEVKQTNYKNEDIFNSLKVTTELDVIVIREQTLNKMIYNKGNFMFVTVNNDSSYYITSNEKINTSNKQIIGQQALEKNEIVISRAGLNSIYSKQIDEASLPDYLNETVRVSFSYNNQSISEEFVIKGISLNEEIGSIEEQKIYFSDSFFEETFKDTIIENQKEKSTLAITFDQTKELQKLINELKRERLYIINSYSLDLDSIITSMRASNVLVSTILIGLIPIAVCLVYYISGVLLKNNKKNFGILYSNGFSKDKLWLLIAIENFILVITSFILTFIGYIFFQRYLNHIFSKHLSYDMEVFKLNLYQGVYLMFMTFIITLIFSSISLYRVNRYDILSLLKE